MPNPLLEMSGLPPFSRIKPEHVEPAIDSLLDEIRETVNQRLNSYADRYSWDNLIQPLEDMDDRLSRAWSPVSHMNSVVNNDALRKAYNTCLPKLSEYATEMGQNRQLYEAYKFIKDRADFTELDVAQQKIIDNALRDFHLSGVDLSEEKKNRYREIRQRLSQLTTRYEENVLDATQAWNILIEKESRLAGLPDSARAMAKQAAEQKEKTGWLFTLDFPSYYAVITYADDRSLREEIHHAYVTRASDQFPLQGAEINKWDNAEVMDEILALRHESAQLLGYPNYAERSLVTKMADSPQRVIGFLHDLAQRAKPVAEKELQALQDFAREHYDISELQPWDIACYSEKLRQHTFDISQEELKPYFPETRVIPGMFEVVKRLYGLSIQEVEGVDSWHKDVRFFDIYDEDNELRGQFYLDLYARENKRGGAWMDDCIDRKRNPDSSVQTPVAYLTCNLTPPINGEPAQFTHDEVITLFHEFGHGLHHMLTRIDHLGVSGISGVAWDAVELPSQFMENWCWEKDALNLICGHVKTGDPLPDALFNKMYAAKNFQSGMQMLRQLEFSLFDFHLHLEYDPADKSARAQRVQKMIDKVRADIAVIQPAPYNRFQNSFSHIFAGGYAAGYYSYKWAEVLSADAFSLFEEKGIFDPASGRKFLHTILEQGGSKEPMELFIDFRGREPEINALLRHSGIAE
ncbi:Oligopeptidase A [hydrothermal vent metagenome]|uniref:oligopeptidase A n=1 Tax=hydrothermal vent metagenome TaxID=652676 RepID=A0A3B1B5E7_9ZZZZ